MKRLFAFITVLAAPISGFAGNATTVEFNWITQLINQVQNIVDLLIPLLIAIALLLFIWGLVVYIFNSGDDAAKEEGKRKMIWGVLALFVIVSVWGLVALLNEITGVDQGGTVTTPFIPR